MRKVGEELGYSILLLDDETMILMGLEDAARAAGLRPVTALNCEEALALIDQGEQIDLAVLDFRLSGGHTCAPVASGLRRRGVPILMHTADSDLTEVGLPDDSIARIAKPSTSTSVIEAAIALLDSNNDPLKQAAE
ncbi:MAG: response regulator [Pseudomonadota bacterium]